LWISQVVDITTTVRKNPDRQMMQCERGDEADTAVIGGLF
jgi:hypothetical protein